MKKDKWLEETVEKPLFRVMNYNVYLHEELQKKEKEMDVIKANIASCKETIKHGQLLMAILSKN